MKRHLLHVFLSNTLLMGFGLAWLLLIYVPILVAPDHYMGIWYEDNPAILWLEVAACVFGIGWAANRIAITIKQERRRCTEIDY